MPSSRRVKVLATALVIAVFTIIYLSRDSSSQEFYSRTVAALEKKEASDFEVSRQLQEAKNAAKNQAPIAAPSLPKPPAAFTSNEVPQARGKLPDAPTAADETTQSTTLLNEVASFSSEDTQTESEKSIAGRKTMKGGELKDLHSGKEVRMGADIPNPGEMKKDEKIPEKSKEEQEVDAELNSILKKGPIIVFSKSYCPYSKKAKNILLDKYTIVPAPYVVELDRHELGPRLQAALEKSTGRRTVPNVLINGKSIGGGDDVAALDAGGTLVEKIRSMGGKRIMELKARDV